MTVTMNRLPKNYGERRSGLIVPLRAIYEEDDHQGTLGPEIEELMETMTEAGFYQLHDLPFNPPDGYNCPYSSVSTFAIDSQRINLARLAEVGDITTGELDDYQAKISSGNAGPDIETEKENLLKRAFIHFDSFGSPDRKQAFTDWCEKKADWLDSYAAFEILKKLEGNEGKRWQDWETGKDHSPKLVDSLRDSKAFGLEFAQICYMQWIAEEQTLHYLEFARELGVEVVGDLPFYTGDCDVWANRDNFNLDADGEKLTVGGAPPSDTSATGQKWGNATYKITPETIDWWVKRVVRAVELNAGEVRLDHFLAFAEPFLIAASSEDGKEGVRGEGIGDMLFEKLVEIFGNRLPLYPEDLGEMSEKTRELREKYGFKTSKVDARGLIKHLPAGLESYLNSENNPDNYTSSTVAFSSTHDSPPLIQALNDARIKYPVAFRQYLSYLSQKFPERGLDENPSLDKLARIEIERVIGSQAVDAVIGIWDLVGLGEEGRYNIPGKTDDRNWSLRLKKAQVYKIGHRAPAWRELNEAGSRLPQDVS